jgi:hypothetical protein
MTDQVLMTDRVQILNRENPVFRCFLNVQNLNLQILNVQILKVQNLDPDNCVYCSFLNVQNLNPQSALRPLLIFVG